LHCNESGNAVQSYYRYPAKVKAFHSLAIHPIYLFFKAINYFTDNSRGIVTVVWWGKHRNRGRCASQHIPGITIRPSPFVGKLAGHEELASKPDWFSLLLDMSASKPASEQIAPRDRAIARCLAFAGRTDVRLSMSR